MGRTRLIARNRLTTFVIAALIAAPASLAQEAGDWVELFNGKDLSNWVPKISGYPTGENYANTFRVEDGLLTVSYDGYKEFGTRFGHLFYNQPYSHYRLRVEYRFVGEQVSDGEGWAWRNSGVMLHSQDPETMPPEQDFPISLEAQFLGGYGDGRPRPTANLCTPGTHVEIGGVFTEEHCIESTSNTFDGDQWVTVETLVLGDEKIVHSVNGTPVIEYENPTTGGGVVSGHRPEMKPEGKPLASGYISLQSESHPIQFRRVTILNLSGCMDPDASNYKDYYVNSTPEACRD